MSKPSIQVDSGSRFQLTGNVLVPSPDDNNIMVETFSMWVRPSFLVTRPSKDQIGVYQVQPGQTGRPDQIALALYGSQYLDWVLIAFNNALDVIGWPLAGVVIEYPLPSVVAASID